MVRVLFLFILFISFCLPTNSSFYINLPGIQLKYSELGYLILPILNACCSRRYDQKVKSLQTFNINVIFLISIVFITEFVIKYLIFYQGPMDAFKSIRIGLPLFSSLLILKTGLNIDIKLVWRTLCLAILFSILLSFISIIIPLPIYSKLEDQDLLIFTGGRIINSNASFGFIGLYFFFNKKGEWFNKGRFYRIVYFFSIISLVATFNRTYLVLFLIALLYLVLTNNLLKMTPRIILFCIILVGVFMGVYNNIEAVRDQIDRRILSILIAEQSIYESTISNNRDFIYSGIKEKISQFNWVIGLPYSTPIFVRPAMYGLEATDMRTTDTSFINIVLRFGIIPLLLTIGSFIVLLKRDLGGVYKFLFIIFLFASWNIDSLLQHNSVFFLLLTFLLTNTKEYLSSKFKTR